MKKTLSYLLLFVLIFPTIGHAASIKISETSINVDIIKNSPISREQAFDFLAGFYRDTIPESYKYIDLNFSDVLPWTELYKDLQTLVYLDLIKNSSASIYPNKKIDIYTFSMLSSKILWISAWENTNKELSKIQTTARDLQSIRKIVEDEQRNNTKEFTSNNISTEKIEILTDVYNTILDSHVDKTTLDKEKLLYSAIEWLAKGTDDEFTTYFPPTESKSFQENVNGEFEWIGSYVEMPEPGKFIIISPIVGSPSEQAGIKWGDQVTHVDGVEITKDIGVQEAISWIKWPKGTNVVLTILRGNTTLDIEVTRDTIVIKDIEYEFIGNSTFYIQIKWFWLNVSKDFTEAIKELEGNTRVKKVIIDVRNNPGGFLDEVSKILSNFVPEWEATAIIQQWDTEQEFTSTGEDLVDFSKYKIRLLQNSGSASASEILVGTIKDYHPKSLIIGEKSFGKWSVQSIKNYGDGSSLKVTIAKWFTGKTRTSIDKVGIPADIEIELTQKDIESDTDTQLDTALRK